MKLFTTLLLTTSILLTMHRSYGQANLSSDLSLLFSNLPMHLPAKEIIAVAEKSKDFKGNTHYNLELSYSGIATKTNFFKLKPGACFIEIASNAAELSTDSLMENYSLFLFDASYNKTDSLLIRKEFNRIIGVFSADFPSGKIETEDERVCFYKTKAERRPTLIIYRGRDNDCYNGKRCIKFTYIKESI